MVLLVIADDTESRLLIKNQLKSVSEIDSILESNSAEDALFVILEKNPNIIIASNNLPGRKGFELAFLLQKINCESLLIILSDRQSDAIDAIRAKVFDFLVYPFPGERLVTAVKRSLCEIENSQPCGLKDPKANEMKVKISVANGFSLIDLNLLSYCMADGSYTDLFFSNGKIECSSYNLGKLEDILREYHFIRINRSVIINMKMLKNIDEKAGICKIDTGIEIHEFKISKLSVKKLTENQFN